MTDLCRRTILMAPLGFMAACSSMRWYRPATAKDGSVRVPLVELDAEGFVQVEASNQAFLLQRAADGTFSAVTLTCSHQGCAVSKRRDELVCPCHGSRFDLHGTVLNGPAEKPLRTYKVELDGDVAVVHLESA